LTACKTSGTLAIASVPELPPSPENPPIPRYLWGNR